jgi:4-amino-4-deoxy-L-arabinose transferase-like glycosyltransferase
MKAPDATSILDSAARQGHRARPAMPGTTRLGQPKPVVILGLLLLFVALGTLYGAITSAGAPANHDTLEAYVWGREFQLGYYKHPPFWSWAAGLWFLVFAHANWALAMLAMVNAGIGLIGVWMCAGCFVQGESRTLSVLLLLLTPFYTFFALKYNANTIFLSLWPWTAYFFVRSLERERWRDAIAFGVLAGCDILSKYYAVIFLGACLIAALSHPARKRYFLSLSPYLSMGVAALLAAPHVYWLVQTNFLPFHYFAGETGHSIGHSLRQALSVTATSVLFLGLAVALMFVFGRPRVAGRSSDPKLRLLAILALAPFVLTIAASFAFGLALSHNTAGATFALVPLLLVELASESDWRRLLRITSRAAAAVAVLSVLASPVLGYERMRNPWSGSVKKVEPGQELALAATQIWHQRGGQKLSYVTGTRKLADAISFYSNDSPSELIEFNYAYSPWVTPGGVNRSGILVACDVHDQACLKAGVKFDGSWREDLALSHTFFGVTDRPVRFVLFVVPPHADATGAKDATQRVSAPANGRAADGTWQGSGQIPRSPDSGIPLRAVASPDRAMRAPRPRGRDGT